MEEGEYQLEEGEDVPDSSEENCADDINSPENNGFLNVSEEEQIKNDESIEFGNELDFEEGEKESGEEGEDLDDDETRPIEVSEIREDGEISEEEEEDPSLRQEPKTVCRFFNKGQCTWGTNCRFLHPGVSDKGNYNMFAPPKPQSHSHSNEDTTEKERQPRDVRPHVQEPSFESAWERGLRHAKEMMKRASKRKETDADFEEKRLNLSLGQAELDRENDYYTRPASPVYKTVDVEYPDPYERQAIRHFRGGHIENIEVRYNVEPSYPGRGGGHLRSRREKFDREVTERVMRRMRPPPSPPVHDHPRMVKEKRYPRPRTWSDDKAPPIGDVKEEGKQEAESWADPWARRRSPAKTTKRKEQRPRSRRSYSTGSSSRSSRSSRSSSYSSYSGSSSRSSRSRSSSRSITPPVHPRQRALANRGRGGVRGGDRGTGRPVGQGVGRGRYTNQNPESFSRPQPHRRPEVEMKENKIPRIPEMKGPMPKQPRDRIQSKIENRLPNPVPPRLPQRKQDPRLGPEMADRVDMFGRTIRKEQPVSPPRSVSRSPTRRSRKFSLSPSRSRSYSGNSRSSSSGSNSSRSSRSPTPPPPPPPPSRRKDQRVKMTEGTVSYGEALKKSKNVDVVKVTSQKQPAKLSIKRQVPPRRERPVVSVEDDSGESDTGGRIKKRKADVLDIDDAPPLKIPKQLDPAQLLRAAIAKKPQGRREELLKQLRAVEDAIARKRGKPII